MENKHNTSVTIFRNGKSYYYQFNDKQYEINAITINKLKERLDIPFKVGFYALSRAQIGKIIGMLLDKTLEVQLKQINNQSDNILRYEASFQYQKKYIDAYKVPNISSLYSRVSNCNPFLYTCLNSKKILIEVSKEYAKKNNGEYYFLSCDLDKSEKEFFDSLHTKLEYEYLYKMEKTLNNKKKRKKLR